MLKLTSIVLLALVSMATAQSKVISYHYDTKITVGFVDALINYKETSSMATSHYCYIGNPQTVCPEIQEYFLSLNPANGEHEGGETTSCEIVNEDYERYPDAVHVSYRLFDDRQNEVLVNKVIEICTSNGL